MFIKQLDPLYCDLEVSPVDILPHGHLESWKAENSDSLSGCFDSLKKLLNDVCVWI
jgi:hypothetical protein